MIFGKEYDLSLWYIIKADKRNRYKIIEFIKEIPIDLINNIDLAIEKSKNEEIDYSKYDGNIYKITSYKDSNIKYYFYIDNIDYCLTIAKEYNNDGKRQTLFELMLFPLRLEMIKMFDEEWIGTISNYNSNCSLTEISQINNKYEYNLYNTPIGYFISYHYKCKNIDKLVSIFKPINIRKVPEDLNKENLLVKKSKRK